MEGPRGTFLPSMAVLPVAAAQTWPRAGMAGCIVEVILGVMARGVNALEAAGVWARASVGILAERGGEKHADVPFGRLLAGLGEPGSGLPGDAVNDSPSWRADGLPLRQELLNTRLPPPTELPAFELAFRESGAGQPPPAAGDGDNCPPDADRCGDEPPRTGVAGPTPFLSPLLFVDVLFVAPPLVTPPPARVRREFKGVGDVTLPLSCSPA